MQDCKAKQSCVHSGAGALSGVHPLLLRPLPQPKAVPLPILILT
jgi:hypothetical protein